MNNQPPKIHERTKFFAIRCVKAYSQIIAQKNFNDPAVILAKQFLRSSTSIGANCKESISAQSTKDFIHKLEIALKEARETEYWIEIFIESEIVSRQKMSLLLKEIDEIIRTLVTIIKTSKENAKKSTLGAERCAAAQFSEL